MPTMITLENMGTAVDNTKTLIADAIAAHNSDADAHSDTVVTTSGLQIHIDPEPPSDTSKIWFDTSGYET